MFQRPLDCVYTDVVPHAKKKTMIRLTCNNCGTDYQFEDLKLDFELVSSDERQMGPENEYVGQIEFDCNKCKNHIAVEFDFWEYPMEALNYSEYSEEGCIVTEEPNYQSYLSEKPEIDDYE